MDPKTMVGLVQVPTELTF